MSPILPSGYVYSSCDFEDGLCGWKNLNWTRTEHQSPLQNTGPHNAASGSEWYLKVCERFVFQSLFDIYWIKNRMFLWYFPVHVRPIIKIQGRINNYSSCVLFFEISNKKLNKKVHSILQVTISIHTKGKHSIKRRF